MQIYSDWDKKRRTAFPNGFDHHEYETIDPENGEIVAEYLTPAKFWIAGVSIPSESRIIAWQSGKGFTRCIGKADVFADSITARLFIAAHNIPAMAIKLESRHG